MDKRSEKEMTLVRFVKNWFPDPQKINFYEKNWKSIFSEENLLFDFLREIDDGYAPKKNLGFLSIVLKYRTLNIKLKIPQKQKN